MVVVPTPPSGPMTAAQWAAMLNIPLDQVRIGSVVTPFGYGGQSFVFIAA